MIELLKAEKPKQCPECNFGPITKKGCDNLQTHNFESRNACPRCFKHYTSYSALPDWDGKLPEETEVFTDKKENINNNLLESINSNDFVVYLNLNKYYCLNGNKKLN